MSMFSVTDRGTFKTCRFLWDHVSLSRQGLEHALPGKALLLGSLVHYTFADWLAHPDEKDPAWVNPGVRFDKHFETAKLDIYQRYLAKNGIPMSDVEFDESYGEPVGRLGNAMISNYYQFHSGLGLLDLGMKIVAVEQPVTIPVPGTEHFIEGTFDALLADAKGRLYVVDHKTFERRPSQTELLLNDQFLAYTWMANQLGMGEVAGVIYNGLWKRESPPRGREIEDLYFKTFIPHSRDELLDFQGRLAVELNEMGGDPAIYLNRAWYSCPSCPIEDLCLAKTRGEDYTQEFSDLVPRIKTPAWRSVA